MRGRVRGPGPKHGAQVTQAHQRVWLGAAARAPQHTDENVCLR